MAILAKLAKTLTLAAKAGAHTAAEAPGHVRGHFATNSKTGVKSWVRDYTRKVAMVDRMPKVASAKRGVMAAHSNLGAAYVNLANSATKTAQNLVASAEKKVVSSEATATKVRATSAKNLKAALGTKLKPAAALSSEHKAFDVYHRGQHLGTVESYTTSSRHVPGKIRAQPGKARTRWSMNPKQVAGAKYKRSESDLPDKNYAIRMLKLAHGIRG